MKCPKCSTYNAADRYEKAYSTATKGTFHYRCMDMPCGHEYSAAVDEAVDIRERVRVDFRATEQRMKTMEKTDC